MDFSVVLGGPLFQLFRRVRLAGNALELVRQRMFVTAIVAWLPLLVLSVADGQAWNGRAAVPFLLDVEAHTRFLVALPLLVFAELIVHQRMRGVVREFLNRHLIPERRLPQFEAAIASAYRLRNSLLAEVLIIAVVYVFGVLIAWRRYIALATTVTWYAMPTDGGLNLSLAGWWYACVSLPIFQFMLLRWYYRILIWARFLWQVSRIELSLVPTHPDRVGGLGFLANVAYAFTPLAAAHGAIAAGPIANRIFYLHATLTQFKMEIAGAVFFLLCLTFGPFLVFVRQLASTKRTGLREYGRLAERYVREFDSKWIRGGTTTEEPLVGSADIQSLADLGNSFEVVKTMRFAPITRDAVLTLSVATLVPLMPLLLTMMSLEDLLKKLLGVVL